MPSHAKMRTSLTTAFELAFPTKEIRLNHEFFTTFEDYLCRNAVIWRTSAKNLCIFCEKNWNISPECNTISSTLACGGIHLGRVEPASPRHGDASWVCSTPRSSVPGSQHLVAKLARFESTGASALHIHTLPFGLNPGGAMDIGVWSAEVC